MLMSFSFGILSRMAFFASLVISRSPQTQIRHDISYYLLNACSYSKIDHGNGVIWQLVQCQCLTYINRNRKTGTERYREVQKEVHIRKVQKERYKKERYGKRGTEREVWKVRANLLNNLDYLHAVVLTIGHGTWRMPWLLHAVHVGKRGTHCERRTHQRTSYPLRNVVSIGGCTYRWTS